MRIWLWIISFQLVLWICGSFVSAGLGPSTNKIFERTPFQVQTLGEDETTLASTTTTVKDVTESSTGQGEESRSSNNETENPSKLIVSVSTDKPSGYYVAPSNCTGDSCNPPSDPNKLLLKPINEPKCREKGISRMNCAVDETNRFNQVDMASKSGKDINKRCRIYEHFKKCFKKPWDMICPDQQNEERDYLKTVYSTFYPGDKECSASTTRYSMAMVLILLFILPS